MITQAKNKMEEAGERIDQKKELIQFHFPGSGLYFPLTIEASSREEAELLWKEKRRPVDAEKKVETIIKEN